MIIRLRKCRPPGHLKKECSHAFDALDARINNFESRIEAKVDALDGRLTTLEEKVDTRLRETRLLWEAVLARLTGVEERLGSLEKESRMARRAMRGLKKTSCVHVPRTQSWRTMWRNSTSA